MNTNWIRQTNVQIGSVMIDALDIEFTMESAREDASRATADIKIWNITAKTLQQIKIGDQVLLTAGYQGNSGIIFLGLLKSIAPGREGADTFTDFTCTDFEWPKDMQPKKYPKGERIGTIIACLQNDANLPTGTSVSDLGVTLTSDYTTEPNGSSTLNHLLDLINGDPDVKKKNIIVHHTIIGGEGCVIASNETLSDTHIISPETGLLETSLENSDECSRTASILLNWRIQHDAKVELTTSLGEGNGVYKIVSYSHRCDEGTYTTELKLKAAEGEKS